MGIDASGYRSPDSHEDDLQQIDDIGRATAEALYRAGIRSFAALAAASPESLAELLRAQAGLRVSPRRIANKDWIGQANRLMGQGDAYVQWQAEPAAHPQPQGPIWHQHAGFSLFFDQVSNQHGEVAWQARLYHEESGNEAMLEGSAFWSWAKWIIRQADLPGGPAAPPPAPGPSPLHAPRAPLLGPAPDLDEGQIGVEVLDVDVRQAVGPGGQLIGRLLAEVRFQLTGMHSAALIESRAAYVIEFHLVSLITQAGRPMAIDHGSFDPATGMDELVHRTEFAIPAAGRYKLHTMLLIPPHGISSYYEGPIVNVEA